LNTPNLIRWFSVPAADGEYMVENISPSTGTGFEKAPLLSSMPPSALATFSSSGDASAHLLLLSTLPLLGPAKPTTLSVRTESRISNRTTVEGIICSVLSDLPVRYVLVLVLVLARFVELSSMPGDLS
jgi:hypothetical protein